MKIFQLAKLTLELHKEGVIRTDYGLEIEHVTAIILLARGYLIEQKKINKTAYSQVAPASTTIDIVGSKAMFPIGFDSSTVNGILLVNTNDDIMCDNVSMLNQQQKNLVCDSIYIYYIVTQKGIEFINLPMDATKVNVLQSSSSTEDDEVSLDIAYLIMQETFKLLRVAETDKKDSSINMNSTSDLVKEQLRSLQNNPNNIN